MEIFSGLERAHGTYEITGTKNTSKGVKKEGRAKTLHEPVTLDICRAPAGALQISFLNNISGAHR